MRKIFVIISCLLIMSCCKYKMTHLSDEDLEWTSFIVQGKEELFKSSTGVVDTLKYTYKRTYDDSTQYYIIENVSDTREANSFYDFKVYHNSRTIDGTFAVIRRYGLDSLRCFYHFAGFFSDNIPCELENSLPLDTVSLCLNRIIYNDVFVADSSNSHYSKGNLSKEYEREGMQIEKFAVSKTKGIIYYKYKDGEEFFIEESEE